MSSNLYLPQEIYLPSVKARGYSRFHHQSNMTPTNIKVDFITGEFSVKINSDDRAIPFTGSTGGGHAPSSGASGNSSGADSSGNSASENLKQSVDLLKGRG
jgi:hypothetical protein